MTCKLHTFKYIHPAGIYNPLDCPLRDTLRVQYNGVEVTIYVHNTDLNVHISSFEYDEDFPQLQLADSGRITWHYIVGVVMHRVTTKLIETAMLQQVYLNSITPEGHSYVQ